MTDEAAMETDGSRRRKRRRSKKNAANPAAVGRTVFWIMVVLSLLVGIYATHRMRLATVMLDALMVDMSGEEVVYLKGEPLRRSADGRVWTYPAGSGGAIIVRFDDRKAVRSIGCVRLEQGGSGCASVMGVGFDDTEDHLVNRLGPPTAAAYIPGGKAIAYNDLGLIFVMREYRVDAFIKVKRESRVAFLPRALWYLLP